jgi:hypothetical protein
MFLTSFGTIIMEHTISRQNAKDGNLPKLCRRKTGKVDLGGKLLTNYYDVIIMPHSAGRGAELVGATLFEKPEGPTRRLICGTLCGSGSSGMSV